MNLISELALALAILAWAGLFPDNGFLGNCD